MAGAFGKNVDCAKGWEAGRYRSSDSMCVAVVSDSDVRCYKQCQYGEGIETFVVPDQKTCDEYDSAYKSTGAPFAARKQVLGGLASFLFQQAVKKAQLLALNGT